MAHVLGTDISASARNALLEPGSDRRTVERMAMSLSGYPVYRSYSALPVTTGLLADWRAVGIVIQDPISQSWIESPGPAM